MTIGVLATGEAVVAANGTASVSFGPGTAYRRWRVARCSVTVTGVLEPACVVSKGSVNGYRLASTDAGASDDADFNPMVDLLPGEQLTVAWTGASVGAIAAATVWGESGSM